MAVRQVYTPNVGAAAKRGWCLMYVDDAGQAPARTPNARAAINKESAAGRVRTDPAPIGVWVPGFLDLRAGINAGDDHVFLMKNLGGGQYEIRDSETNSGARSIYPNIDAVVAWFGKYAPVYIGWSTFCDGRQYAEDYLPAPVQPAQSADTSRINAKGTAKVTVDALNIRNSPHSKNGVIVGQYKKGETFNYDSYIVINGFVWLSYVSFTGVRRYVAEGPNDGNSNNVYVTGGVA